MKESVALSMVASGDWLGLKDKVCVITGAGGGIGRSLALNFAGAGAKVVLVERDEESARGTAMAVLRQVGVEAGVVACDVSEPASVSRAAAQSASLAGPCDVLINNAALMRPGPLESLSLAEWNTLLSVNLTGYFLCSQIFGVQMRQKQAGAIVHVASISGSHPQGFSGAYSVSKAGIIMLSKQIATEWGTVGIRSNVVSPGMIETPLTSAFYATPGVREKRSAVVPAARIGQPQDIADAAVFLASKRAGYITGEEITVDGGYTRMLMNLIPRPGYEGG